MANTTTGARSGTYKAVPERSTSAISSGLDRLFGTSTPTRVDSPSRFIAGWIVDGIERRVISDLLAYWQVCTILPTSCRKL